MVQPGLSNKAWQDRRHVLLAVVYLRHQGIDLCGKQGEDFDGLSGMITGNIL